MKDGFIIFNPIKAKSNKKINGIHISAIMIKNKIYFRFYIDNLIMKYCNIDKDKNGILLGCHEFNHKIWTLVGGNDGYSINNVATSDKSKSIYTVANPFTTQKQFKLQFIDISNITIGDKHMIFNVAHIFNDDLIIKE